MTTKAIAAATAQIALNKNHINILHQAIHSFKIWREKAHKDGDERYVKLLNAAIKKDANKIARYVEVQKAAKKHLAMLIANSRCSFYVEQKSLETVLKSMRNVVKGADWMNSCGKESIQTALHDGVAVDIAVDIAENLRKYNDVRGMEAI